MTQIDPINTSMKTYTVTLTEKQIGVIQAACEVLARLGIGQFSDALDWLPTKPDYDRWHDDQIEISRILKRHMIDGIDGYSSNFSVHSPKVSESVRIAWDLYQVVRHRLSWDRAIADGYVASLDAPRNWNKMLGVCYDNPMVISSEPPAVIKGEGDERARHG